jgi:N-acetylmuramoyl-L-alanine amidase-like protein
MTYALDRMIDASKRFGLKVEVVPGAETRSAGSFNPFGLVGHHTAGPKTGIRPSLSVCVNGRSDLSGPLCNDFLDRNGVDVIVACGRANHAGAGSFRGILGNSGVWGIEAEDDGDGSWTPAQIEAYPRLVAARLWLIGRDASWYCAHRTWAPTRKIDPTGISDAWMRSQVAPLLAAGSAGAITPKGTFVTYTAAEEAEVLKAARQINGTIGAGQTGFSGTVEAILGTVQGLVNAGNAETALVRSVGASITDTRSAVLGAVAALPTAGLSDTERAQLATDIATAVNEHGVSIDTDALGQALGADLAGRLSA